MVLSGTVLLNVSQEETGPQTLEMVTTAAYNFLSALGVRSEESDIRMKIQEKNRLIELSVSWKFRVGELGPLVLGS